MKQRTKNFILVIVFIITCSLAYRYSISKTLTLKKQVSLLRESIKNSDEKRQKIRILKLKNQHLDSIIENNNLKFSSVQNQLLTVLNKNSDSLNFKIISFKEPHVFISDNEEKFTSFRFKLEGNYKAFEKILFIIENNYSLGSLVHTSFNIDQDNRTKQKKLQVQAIISYINKETSSYN